MTARKPLIIVSGQIEELPSGDTLSAVSARVGSDAAAEARNRIVNGGIDVDVWNNAAQVTPTASGFVVDQWYFETTVASKLKFQQVADAPAGLKFSEKITVAAQYSPSSTDKFTFEQPIEGIDIVDLQQGSAGALSITTSLWIKGSVAGTYAVSLANSGATRSVIGLMTVSSSWAPIIITVPGCTNGTWLTDEASLGLLLRIDLGSGSNFNNATTGSWVSADARRTSGCVTFVNQAANSTLNITGVQLEAGDTATPFVRLKMEKIERQCARYLPGWRYNTTSGSGSSSVGPYVGINTTTVRMLFQYRAPPMKVPTGILLSAVGDFTGTGITTATAASLLGNSSLQEACVNFTTTGTAATAAGHILSSTTTAYLLFTGCGLL